MACRAFFWGQLAWLSDSLHTSQGTNHSISLFVGKVKYLCWPLDCPVLLVLFHYYSVAKCKKKSSKHQQRLHIF